MEDKFNGVERRKFKRLQIGPIVKLHVNSAPENKADFIGRSMEAVMIDISEGGTSVLLNSNIPVSSLVTAEFDLHNSRPSVKDRHQEISVLGKVCYNRPINSRECRMGIIFTKMSDSDMAFISQFISWERSRLPNG